MKKIILSLAIAMSSCCSYAQWTTSGSTVYYNGGNVGIGNNLPNSLLTIGSASTRGTLNIIGSTTDIGTLNLTDSRSGGHQYSLYNGLSALGSIDIFDQTVSAYRFTLTANGSVGIGTISPNQKLEVAGNVLVRGSGSYYNNPGTGDLQLGYGLAAPNTPGTVTRLAIQPYGHTGGPWKFDARDNVNLACLDIYYGGAGTGTGITLDNNGNLSVGTLDAHGYKFAVNGSAIATSMTVKLYANWPDYVFKPNYRLPSLTAVKAYINKNQHLPDMPSEQEVRDNGINLGEMVKLQTKKIEELTLYLIEKDKQLIEQQKKNDEQECRITALEKVLLKLANNQSK